MTPAPLVSTTEPAEASFTEAELHAAAPVVDSSLLETAKTRATEPGADGGTLAKENDKPLIFAYSESKAHGVWLNKSRMLGLSRLAATGATGFSGYKDKSNWRVAAFYVGLIANLSYFVWGAGNSGRVRELELAHGDWKEENGRMVQSVQGALPKEAIDQVEAIINSAELAPGSIKISYDKGVTKLSVQKEQFELLQKRMQALLDSRIDAVKALQDPARAIAANDKGALPIGAIDLDGLPESTVQSLKRIIEVEWEIPTFTQQEATGRRLHIPVEHQARFMEHKSPEFARLPQHMKLAKLQEQPAGFWEAIVHPEKYPMQFGNNVGGLTVNVLRIIGDAKGDATSNGKPLIDLILASVISQMAYIIEGQREIKNGLHAPSAVEDKKLNAVDHFLAKASEHPMASSVPFKAGSLYFRIRDVIEHHSVGRGIATFFDFVTAGISIGIKKTDYGR